MMWSEFYEYTYLNLTTTTPKKNNSFQLFVSSLNLKLFHERERSAWIFIYQFYYLKEITLYIKWKEETSFGYCIVYRWFDLNVNK